MITSESDGTARVRIYQLTTMIAAAGATHGGDESWLLRTEKTSTPAERELSVDMAKWWTTLGATLDPNGANASPRWTVYVPGSEDMTMFMDAPPRKLRIHYFLEGADCWFPNMPEQH